MHRNCRRQPQLIDNPLVQLRKQFQLIGGTTVCVVFAIQIAILCYESIVQAFPSNRLLRGSIVGAIV